MVQHVTEQDFDQVKKEGVSVIDFSATWCNPCQMMAPVYEEASNEMNGMASFYKVDVGESFALSKQFSISNIPAIVIMKDGEIMETQVGFQPKRSIIKLVKKYL